MSDLRDYLVQKGRALQKRVEEIDSGAFGTQHLAATVTVEGRSGIRRIRVRDFQVITDSPPDFAGYDLGPGSPELQLGVLGSCLAHSYLIQAAALGVPVDAISVDVKGELDPRASRPGQEHRPVHPHNIAYTVHLATAADAATVEELKRNVERLCPILNLLKKPQEISGTVVAAPAQVGAVAAA